ncbi:MAG: PEP-CTERM sorting domain-containing protein [Thermoguttaceae bacterium]|jgi:hypothetical protein
MSNKMCTLVFLAALVLLVGAQCVQAQEPWDGQGSANNWSYGKINDPNGIGNWSAYTTYPDGATVIAQFAIQSGPMGSTITVDNLDGPTITVGAFTVGEMDFSGTSTWVLNNGGRKIAFDNTGVNIDGHGIITVAVGSSATINAGLMNGPAVPLAVLDINPATTGGYLVLAGNNAGLKGLSLSGGVLNVANIPAIPAGPGLGTILINQCGTLESGENGNPNAFATVAAALASGKINPASTGAIGLSASDLVTAINLVAYPTLNLGSTVGGAGVKYGGVLTPGALGYNLGCPAGTLTVASLLGGGNPVNINGPVMLTNPANGPLGPITVNSGQGTGQLNISSLAPLGPAAAITVNGGTIGIVNALAVPNLNAITVNWDSAVTPFNGGISNSDIVNTFSLNNPIGAINPGVSLKLSGAGVKKVNANVTLQSDGTHGMFSASGGTSVVAAGVQVNAGGVYVGNGATLQVDAGAVVNATAASLTTSPPVCSFSVDGGANADIKAGASVSGGALNLAAGGSGTGTINIGELGSGLLTTVGLNTVGDNWNGSIKIGGGGDNAIPGSGANVTINVWGNNTTVSSAAGGGTGAQQLDIGESGGGTATMIVHDSAVLNGGYGGISVGMWNSSTGTLTLNDNSKIISPSLNAGAANGGVVGVSTVNINDHAQVKVIGAAGNPNDPGWTFTDGQAFGDLTVATAWSYGGLLNIGMDDPTDAPTVIVGQFDVAPQWWGGSGPGIGTANIGGYASVHITNQNITTGDAFLQGDWTAASGNASVGGNAGAGILNVQGNATVVIDNNLTVKPGGGNGTLNVREGGTVSVGGALSVGNGTSNATTPGTVNVGSILVTAPGPKFITDGGIVIPVATLTVTGNTTLIAGSSLNIFTNGAATLTGALNVGNATTSGTVNVTDNGSLTVDGTTTLAGGSTVTLDSIGTLSLKAVTGGDIDTVVVGGNNMATATADSVTIGTLTIGAGSTLVINALSGGPSSGGELTPVPEPSTFVLLAIAALGLVGAAWRRRNR